VEKVRQALLLRDRLIAEQRLDEVRGLDRSLFLSSRSTVELDDNNDDDDDDDDRYSLLSPKERLRCVSEMEKSVDSLAVNGGDVTGSGCSAELMLRCIRAMQCKRPTPTCVVTAATSSEVTSVDKVLFCSVL